MRIKYRAKQEGVAGRKLAKHILLAKTPWANRELPACDIPSMITQEEKAYYLYVTELFRGAGEVIEVGSWLGNSTFHIVYGLTKNPIFRGRVLHVFDDFVWRSSWMNRHYPYENLPENYTCFQTLFEQYVQPIKSHLRIARRRLIVQDGNEKVRDLDWSEESIEMCFIDCGRSLAINNAWYDVLSPSFVPDVTLIMMEDWQLHKQRPRRAYNQTKEFTDSKGRALQKIDELLNGALATFLYKGPQGRRRSPKC
jgi:hypothetical protein